MAGQNPHGVATSLSWVVLATLFAGMAILAPAPAQAAPLYITGSSTFRTIDTATAAITTVPVTNVSGTINFRRGFDFAPDGTLYLANNGTTSFPENNVVNRLTPDPLTPGGYIATGFGIPATGFAYNSLSVDSSGNPYVAGRADNTANPNTVYKFDALTGVRSPFYSAGVTLNAIVFDDADNLYVGRNPGGIAKVAPDGTETTLVTSGVTLSAAPRPLAFDAAGNLYAAGGSLGNTLYKITPDGVASTFGQVSGGTGLGIIGVGFDEVGNTYAAVDKGGSSGGTGYVQKITPDGVSTLFISALGFSPRAMRSAPIPEPASLSLLALAGVGLLRRRH